MIRELKKAIIRITENNVKGYILLSAAFAAGFVLAAILRSNAVAEEEIRLYITDFVSNMGKDGASGISTFYIALLSYVRFALVMFLSSITVIGAPVIILYTSVKGFSYGAVMCSLFSVFGGKALLLFMSAVLPHVLISAPCCLMYSCHCMKNSYYLVSGSRDLKRAFSRPLAAGVCFILMASVAALLQAYFEPLLVSLISKRFV